MADDKHVDALIASFRLSRVMTSKINLDKNRAKGHWRGSNVKYLTKRLVEELYELREALETDDLDHIESECADVGNFLMMIYDNEVLYKRRQIKLKEALNVKTDLFL